MLPRAPCVTLCLGTLVHRSAGGTHSTYAAGARSCECERDSVSTDESRKQRPHGLNTVALLKVASSSLNIGPQRAMQVSASSQLFATFLLQSTTICSVAWLHCHSCILFSALCSTGVLTFPAACLTKTQQWALQRLRGLSISPPPSSVTMNHMRREANIFEGFQALS